MPQTIVIESYAEFCERHGGHPARVGENRWLLPDGASVATNPVGGPAMYEPPTDPLECLRNRREYHKTKLARAEQGFCQLKGALLGLLDTNRTAMTWRWDAEAVKEYGPAPTERDPTTGLPDGKAALLRLQAVVHEHRNAIAAIDSEIGAMPEVQEQRRQKSQNVEFDRQRRERELIAREEISEINI
jgi:hypothetical protein